ncbi:putative S-adenosyl-L-methionine (SAM)-dependent methyltransferase [Bradyrhizobium sp. ORS 285]|uniref:class I SAM-dependent methyltransferase n=1 Tax=Bradyrhizobium sp. ORS 285 TaxID=115808 RepID=UPI0002406179|nr:class I SAM-dependent methyltransferase [Bradyrhizobium sp. ORS 285]CCD84853.1 putative S-adenosyl-L-methionine (SAM)-dependent methyltransferase [Bradyrhizobium sp. ORS 285]SMX55658.1 putative S-adenosyl-L-methionine (SAM)-dependent methyltransferase [Bradyrhizobium sp. ORS 285]
MHGATDREIDAIHAGVESYYSDRIIAFGPVPAGADWDSAITQEVRFLHLLKICDFGAPFALNDVGCGYGALLSYLNRYHSETDIDYLGYDLSPAMISQADRLQRDLSRASFKVATTSPRIADYSVASGIFNVSLGCSSEAWERYVSETLADIHASSRRGFAVNFMTPDPVNDNPEGLYCTTPDRWVRFSTDQLRSSARVVAGYGLREFTLLVNTSNAGR